MAHSYREEYSNFLIIIFACLFISGCADVSPPSKPHQLCSIFKEKQSWYNAAKKSSERWKTPIPTMMSIMFQESSYIHDAQPPRPWFFFIPLPRNSSAFGYAQAQDGTWDSYVEEAGNIFSSRSSFADAIDFIGWYMNKSYEINRIPFSRSDLHYLSYHEGWYGFKKGGYKNKRWLINIAKKVMYRSKNYHEQLSRCRVN